MNSLDRKMDRILAQENSGRIKKGIKNRALRKMFANKLSVDYQNKCQKHGMI